MNKVAALYVYTDGPYSRIPGVELWDDIRDARNYHGPHSVVAHPPCQLWGKFAAVNFKRWGGSHNRPGNDGGCFFHALQSVRRFGGVLEHPAGSYAWNTFGLTKPLKTGWNGVNQWEWVCEVYQSAYGHLASKKTWLLYCGVNAPHELRWEKKKGSHQIGFYDQRGKQKNKPTLSGKNASITPPDFASELVRLARNTGFLTPTESQDRGAE